LEFMEKINKTSTISMEELVRHFQRRFLLRLISLPLSLVP